MELDDSIKNDEILERNNLIKLYEGYFRYKGYKDFIPTDIGEKTTYDFTMKKGRKNIGEFKNRYSNYDSYGYRIQYDKWCNLLEFYKKGYDCWYINYIVPDQKYLIWDMNVLFNEQSTLFPNYGFFESKNQNNNYDKREQIKLVRDLLVNDKITITVNLIDLLL